MRREVEEVAALLPPLEGVACLPLDAGGVAALSFTPALAAPRRTMLYLHGGGFAVGSARSHRDIAGRLALAAHARVVSLDYRLAPENPFPAALEDALAAYRWTIAREARPQDVVVAGDSAGGGLVLSTLVALRDSGEPLPAAAVCISPWVDLEALGTSMTTNVALDPTIQRDGVLRAAALYLGSADPRTPLASPIHADLAGLPPLLIQVGTAETLLDDARRIAELAWRAGVAVTLEIWEGMVHDWHLFACMLHEGREAIDRIGRFARHHAAPSESVAVHGVIPLRSPRHGLGTRDSTRSTFVGTVN